VTFPTQTGAFTAPAQAILDEFEQAKREVKADPSCAPLWATKVNSYPHGFLSLCDTVLQLAREKVATWLDTYMFTKDGTKPGHQIAEWLGNANIHKTHGHPIGMQLALDHGLKVTKLEDDPKLQDLVLSVFHATMVAFRVTPCVKLIENHNGQGLYTVVDLAIAAGP
jgi:hypothetical protein